MSQNTEKSEIDEIPEACNDQCNKMRQMGIPSDIYKRGLFYFTDISADEAGLTKNEKSILISLLNSLQNIFPENVMIRFIRQTIALFTESLTARIKELEREIELLKEKHADEIDNHLASIEDISDNSIAALEKTSKDSINVISSSQKATVSEIKSEASEKISGLVDTAKKDVIDKVEKYQHKARESKANARQDELTGLPNKIGFLEYLIPAVNECVKTQQSLFLMFVDIDAFKRINDNYGNKIGDKALKLIAQDGILNIIEKNIAPEHRFIARYGGDQFAGIIKDEDIKTATRIAELVRMKTRQLSKQLQEETNVTIYITFKLSIGISQIDTGKTDSEKTIAALIHRTSSALEEAQKQGGNKVVVQN